MPKSKTVKKIKAMKNDRGTGSCHIDGIGGRGETSWSVTGTCPRVMSATLPT